MKNLEAVYDEKIAPLMTQIIAVCKEHEMPMFASFRYADEQLCSTCLPFEDNIMSSLSDVVYPRKMSAIVLRQKNADGSEVISHIL